MQSVCILQDIAFGAEMNVANHQKKIVRFNKKGIHFHWWK